MTQCGRVGSAGYVTSGRRWHRRIPCHSHDPARLFVSGGAAMRPVLVRTLLLAVLAASTACAQSLHSASIADLRRNPGRYQNHTVSINGVVTTAFSVPLVPFKAY